VVGKYFASGDFTLPDAYISVLEALRHAGWAQRRNVELTWINSEEFEKNPRAVRKLARYDGIFVPGGFGSRGVEGKMKAVRFARENRIPYLGICYGMQLAVIEFARNVLGMKDAHTTEVNPRTKHPVIDLLPSQLEHMAREYFGGTMRLGAYPCRLAKGTKAYAAYRKYKAKDIVSERHRHRYEVNNAYRQDFEKAGAVFSGALPKGELVEIFELKHHPFFLGTQFHPEFKSRPLAPHPLYAAFIEAALKNRRS
jgi:CTP synthase